MTDAEKLHKVYDFVQLNENFFYKPIEEGKYEFGTPGYWQCINQAVAFQKVRYLIEDLMENAEQTV